MTIEGLPCALLQFVEKKMFENGFLACIDDKSMIANFQFYMVLNLYLEEKGILVPWNYGSNRFEIVQTIISFFVNKNELVYQFLIKDILNHLYFNEDNSNKYGSVYLIRHKKTTNIDFFYVSNNNNGYLPTSFKIITKNDETKEFFKFIEFLSSFDNQCNPEPLEGFFKNSRQELCLPFIPTFFIQQFADFYKSLKRIVLISNNRIKDVEPEVLKYIETMINFFEGIHIEPHLKMQ